jgi:hypothetical protein
MERSRIDEGQNQYSMTLWDVICPICDKRVTSLDTNSGNRLHFVNAIKSLGRFNSNDAGWVCPDCERKADRGIFEAESFLMKFYRPVIVRLEDGQDYFRCCDELQPLASSNGKIRFSMCSKCKTVYWSREVE